METTDGSVIATGTITDHASNGVYEATMIPATPGATT